MYCTLTRELIMDILNVYVFVMYSKLVDRYFSEYVLMYL